MISLNSQLDIFSIKKRNKQDKDNRRRKKIKIVCYSPDCIFHRNESIGYVDELLSDIASIILIIDSDNYTKQVFLIEQKLDESRYFIETNCGFLFCSKMILESFHY